MVSFPVAVGTCQSWLTALADKNHPNVASDFPCTQKAEDVENYCLEAIKDFAQFGDINGKFSVTPEMVSTQCNECDLNGVQLCTCDLKVWRFRDWEGFPVNMLDLNFVDW